MNTTLQRATYDDIIMCIHINWERGWNVTPEAIQETLNIGSHKFASDNQITQAIEETVIPGAKDQWLAGFNWESDFAKAHPRPWPITAEWRYQSIE